MNFTIKDAARITGLTPRTLRYYESIGIIPTPQRSGGNYRVYSSEDIEDITRIKRITSLGFPLRSVAQFLENPSGENTRIALKRLAAEMDRQMADLTERRRAIDSILDPEAASTADTEASLRRHAPNCDGDRLDLEAIL